MDLEVRRIEAYERLRHHFSTLGGKPHIDDCCCALCDIEILNPSLEQRAAHLATKIRLKPKDKIMLSLLASGRNSRQAAGDMGISIHTARDRCNTVYRKLDARTSAQAVATALRLGLME